MGELSFNPFQAVLTPHSHLVPDGAELSFSGSSQVGNHVFLRIHIGTLAMMGTHGPGAALSVHSAASCVDITMTLQFSGSRWPVPICVYCGVHGMTYQ